MEQQAPAELSVVARGHNAVHMLPADWSLAPSVLAPTLDRIDANAGTTQLLVIVADADAAVALTQAITAARGGTSPRVVAATGADRAARVLRAGAAPVVVGAPEQLVALLRASALKLDTVRTLAVGWVEEILSAGAGSDLDTVLAEVPKDAARLVITGTLGPSVEDFIERHARRAPRIGAPGDRGASVQPTDVPAPAVTEAADTQPATVSYILTTPLARTVALRRVLDEIDPPSAAVYVRSDASEQAARETLEALGYRGPDATVRPLRGDATEHTALVVLYDVPHNAAEWRGAVAGLPARAVALLLPRQLAQLAAVTGRPMTPLSFSAPLDVARAREAAVRQQLRRELASGTPSRELLALEPLLTEFDGVALAAAALRLLERERAVRSQASDAARAATAAAAVTAATTADRAVRPAEPPIASPPRADRAESDRPRSGPKGDRGASGRPPQRDRRPDSSHRGSERPGTARGGASPYPRDRNHGAASGGGRGRPDRDATDRQATPRPTRRDFGSRGPKVGPGRRRPPDDRPDPRDARPLPRSPR